MVEHLRADNARLYCQLQCGNINYLYQRYTKETGVRLSRSEFVRDVYIPLGHAAAFAELYDNCCNALLDSGLEATIEVEVRE